VLRMAVLSTGAFIPSTHLRTSHFGPRPASWNYEATREGRASPCAAGAGTSRAATTVAERDRGRTATGRGYDVAPDPGRIPSIAGVNSPPGDER
jgi:hypothetical protein